MRVPSIILLAAIALAVPAAPAAAQDGMSFSRALGFSGEFRSGHVAIHRGDGDWRRDRHRRDFRDRRDRGRSSGDVYFGYRDYQGDTLWRADGFNDWWHDRPDRAFPRWVATNYNCERQYWSGGAWRC